MLIKTKQAVIHYLCEEEWTHLPVSIQGIYK